MSSEWCIDDILLKCELFSFAITLTRVILIYATGYSYSSSNPMLWLHTVLALLRMILIRNGGEGVVVLCNICGSLVSTS